jgi:hypothetical protein
MSKRSSNKILYISTSDKKIGWSKNFNKTFPNIDSSKPITFIDFGNVAEFSDKNDILSINNTLSNDYGHVIIISHVHMQKTGSRLIDEAIERIGTKQIIGCIAFIGDPFHKADIINDIMEENNIISGYFIDDKKDTVDHVKRSCRNIKSVCFNCKLLKDETPRENLLKFLSNNSNFI